MQASGKDDAAELPSLLVERGAAVVECDRLQSGEPVVAFVVATQDCQLFAAEPAAAVRDDGWPIYQARPPLLAAPGREPPDAAALWSDATADRSATIASVVGERLVDADFGDEGGMRG